MKILMFYNLTTFSINERDSICHFKFNLKEKLFLNNDFQHIFHHFLCKIYFILNTLKWKTHINIDTCPLVSLILNIFKMVQLTKISLKKIYVYVHVIRPSHYTNYIHSWLCLVAITLANDSNLNRVQKKKNTSGLFFTCMNVNEALKAWISLRSRYEFGQNKSKTWTGWSSQTQSLFIRRWFVLFYIVRIFHGNSNFLDLISSLFLVKNLFLYMRKFRNVWFFFG